MGFRAILQSYFFYENCFLYENYWFMGFRAILQFYFFTKIVFLRHFLRLWKIDCSRVRSCKTCLPFKHHLWNCDPSLTAPKKLWLCFFWPRGTYLKIPWRPMLWVVALLIHLEFLNKDATQKKDTVARPKERSKELVWHEHALPRRDYFSEPALYCECRSKCGAILAWSFRRLRRQRFRRRQ